MVNYWCGVKGVTAMINTFVYIRGGSSSNVWETGWSVDRMSHREGAPEDLGFLGSNPRLCTSSCWNESRFNVNVVMRRLEKDMRPWGPTGDPHESSATNLRGRELTPTDCAGSNLYCAVISGLIRKFPSTYGAMTELIPGLLLHTQQSPETHREHTWLQHDAIYNPRI